MKKKNKFLGMIALLCVIAMLFSGCLAVPVEDKQPKEPIGRQEVSEKEETKEEELKEEEQVEAKPVSLSTIPAYSGRPYVAINDNQPTFSASELKTIGYETYSSLDNLGRTGMAVASVGKDTMPKANEERGSISNIKPTGWCQAQYDNISGKYLYNRCHLIGWQLSAENANQRNLITGTKYLNIEGMLPLENMVADYVKETGNHVAYRIIPIYEGNNLLASGVQMEAFSVEDEGEGICFNVYCYNVQPGITINYATGESTGPQSTATTSKPVQQPTQQPTQQQPTQQQPTQQQPAQQPTVTGQVWLSATGTKYHSRNNCGTMNPNTARQISQSEAIANGYQACKKCY